MGHLTSHLLLLSAVLYNSCIHMLSTDHSIRGQFRLAGWSSGEVQPQLSLGAVSAGGPTKLLRTSPSWDIKPSKAGYSPASLGLIPTATLSLWAKGLSLPEAWVCAAASHPSFCTTVKSPALSPPSLLSVTGMLLGAFRAVPLSIPATSLHRARIPAPSHLAEAQNQREYPDVVWQALCREDSPWLSVLSPAHSTPSTAGSCCSLGKGLSLAQTAVCRIPGLFHTLVPDSISPGLHPFRALPSWDKTCWTSRGTISLFLPQLWLPLNSNLALKCVSWSPTASCHLQTWNLCPASSPPGHW